MKSFEQIWPLVKDHTLLGPHKARSLYNLVIQAPPDLDVVECGVYRGGMTLMMAIQLEDTNRKVLAFDSFEGLPRTQTPRETCYYQTGALKANPGEVSLLLRPYRKNLELHVGQFSDTLPRIQEKIGLVHVDCDVYSSAQECIANLYDKLVVGGIMVFDDFHDLGGGVAQAVLEHVRRTGELISAGPVEQVFIVKGRTSNDHVDLIQDSPEIFIDVSTLRSNQQYLSDLAHGPALPDLPGGSLDRAEQFALKILEIVKWHRQVLKS